MSEILASNRNFIIIISLPRFLISILKSGFAFAELVILLLGSILMSNFLFVRANFYLKTLLSLILLTLLINAK